MDSAKISDKPEFQPHFLDYWRIIRLRKSLILTVFLLVLLTTAGVTFWLLPNRYASSVLMEVNKDQPDVSVESRQFIQGFDPYFLGTQFEILESRSILDGVITSLGLDKIYAAQMGLESLTPEETYELLLKHIKVQQKRNTSLIEVWVYDADKELAANIANKIADVYKDYRLKRWQNSQEGLKILQDQLAALERKIETNTVALDIMSEKLKIPIIASGDQYTETLDPQTLRSWDLKRIDAESEYNTDNNLLTRITNMPPEKLRGAMATLMPMDTGLGELAAQLALAEQKFTATKATLGEKNLEYQKDKELLDQARQKFDSKIASIIDGLENRVAAKKANLDQIVTAKDAQTKMGSENQTLYRPYFDLKRQVEAMRQNKEKLEFQATLKAIDTKQPLSSIVYIATPATPGLKPVSPKKALNIILGAIIGLAVGIGLAFFIEYLDTSIKTIDDVEKALEAPVLAVIPQQVGVLLDEGPESPHLEAYRVLRTNLLFSRKDESWNTITVLSAGAGEGKSTTLFNLATTFAQNGSKVLVVDSDLCRPSIHKMLHVSNSIGLTDHLLKGAKLEEVIQTTPQENLHILPSGKLPRTSMGVLSSVQMKELIKNLKQRYDFVFFDSPPLLGVSDAAVLASQMDMILQVIQYRRYPQLMTIRAKQMILKVGGHLMGIVLNNINMSQDENYYYYSGYYEYKSKQNDDSEVKPATTLKKSSDVEIKQKY